SRANGRRQAAEWSVGRSVRRRRKIEPRHRSAIGARFKQETSSKLGSQGRRDTKTKAVRRADLRALRYTLAVVDDPQGEPFLGGIEGNENRPRAVGQAMFDSIAHGFG